MPYYISGTIKLVMKCLLVYSLKHIIPYIPIRPSWLLFARTYL